MSESIRDKEKQQESGVSRRKFLAGSAMALGAAGLSLTAPGAIRPANAAKAMKPTSGCVPSRPSLSGSTGVRGLKLQARHSA